MGEKEFTILNVRIPKTMREIIDVIVRADMHSNVSEFVREAIREKIKREAPQLVKNLLEEE